MAVGRQFGREASVYLGGFVGAGIIQFVAIPVYTRALGPGLYGDLTLTIAVTTALAGVMVLGGDVALARFWIDATDKEGLRRLAGSWITFLTLWSIVVGACAALAAPRVANWLDRGGDYQFLLLLGIAALIPAQLSRMLAQVLRNQFRPGPYALTTVAVASFNVALGMVFVLGLGLGVAGVLLGIVLGESAGCLIRLPLVRSSLRVGLDGATNWPMIRFGTPLVLASVAMWVFTGADRIVVGAQLSQNELGGYGLAATLIAPFTVFTLALGQAWIPRVYSLYATAASEAKASIATGIEWAQAGLGGAAAVVGFLAPWIVGLIGGEGFEAGSRALPLLALGSAYAGTVLFTGTGLTLMKRTVLIPLVTLVAAVVDIAMLLALVPRLALVGAGLAVASSYFTLAIGTLALANRAFPLDLHPRRLALVSGALWAQVAISTARPGTVEAAIGLVLCLTVVATTIWTGQRGSTAGRAATTT